MPALLPAHAAAFRFVNGSEPVARPNGSALLDQVREAFGQSTVTLLERRPDTGSGPELGHDPAAWRVAAVVGERPSLSPAQGDSQVAVGGICLVLRGRPLAAYVALGLAILVKGPLALALVATPTPELYLERAALIASRKMPRKSSRSPCVGGRVNQPASFFCERISSAMSATDGSGDTPRITGKKILSERSEKTTAPGPKASNAA